MTRKDKEWLDGWRGGVGWVGRWEGTVMDEYCSPGHPGSLLS